MAKRKTDDDFKPKQTFRFTEEERMMAIDAIQEDYDRVKVRWSQRDKHYNYWKYRKKLLEKIYANLAKCSIE